MLIVKKKLCYKACGDVELRSHVAHGTHDGTFPGAVFIAHKNLKNKVSDQYAVMYNNPVPNIDSHGVHTDPNMTANLNNNRQMLLGLYRNSKPDNSAEFKALTKAQDIDNENIN